MVKVTANARDDKCHPSYDDQSQRGASWTFGRSADEGVHWHWCLGPLSLMRVDKEEVEQPESSEKAQAFYRFIPCRPNS
jgi:hypothetical protein